jgi:hypothetical protein
MFREYMLGTPVNSFGKQRTGVYKKEANGAKLSKV